jgi:acyl-CoA reductase-like NAD-dependent aldehyde dehydrogenase
MSITHEQKHLGEEEATVLRQLAKLPNGPSEGALDRLLELLDRGPVASWIGGKEHSSTASFDILDPSTGAYLGSGAQANAGDVDAAVQSADQAFRSWRTVPRSQRAQLLNRIADLIDRDAEYLAVTEALDTGRPLWETRAVDVPLMAAHFRYFAGWAMLAEGTTIPLDDPNMFTYTIREPIGVVAGIIPWNFPMVFAAYRIAAPLAFGNTVVVKPAEQASLSVVHLARLAAEAGVPAGVVNVVLGKGDTGAALVAHPQVGKVAFTGSVETGRRVAQSAANTIKNVSLELGGKSANIVFADAPLEAAVGGVAGGIFFSQGQVCTAGSRLFVAEEIRDDLLSSVGNHMRGFHIGHSLDPATTMGPLVSLEQKRRVDTFVRLGREGGDTIIDAQEGDLPNELAAGYFVTPTLLSVKNSQSVLATEEVFGPVLAVDTFTTDDEAIDRANATTFGLANGIWTKDLSRAHRAAARLESGTVWINTYNMFDAAAPISGYKLSGTGRELGSASIDLYTHSKTVWVNTAV